MTEQLIGAAAKPDTQIRVGETVFAVNRALLVQHSPYCHRLFADIGVGHAVRLPDDAAVSPDIFAVVARWIRTGCAPALCMNNVADVHRASKTLEIEGLSKKCLEYAQDLFESRGPMEIYELAIAGNLQNLTAYALTFATRNFMVVVQQLSFVRASCSQVVTLLSNDHLNVPGEKSIFDAACLWLKADWAERSKYTSDVLSCVRFMAMTLDELYECCEPPYAFLVQQPQIIGYFFKALLYRLAIQEGCGEAYRNVFPQANSRLYSLEGDAPPCDGNEHKMEDVEVEMPTEAAGIAPRKCVARPTKSADW